MIVQCRRFAGVWHVEPGTLRKTATLTRNRSGCQNLTLAIKTSPVISSGYGNASRITSRALGSDPARSPGLYSGAGSACGDHGFHGHTLQEQVRTLQEQLNQTSRNSSRPSSSDPPQHERPRRPRSKRRRGGQPGHPGHTRTLIPMEEVDEVVVLKPAQCTHCHAPLRGDDPRPWRHQIIEIRPQAGGDRVSMAPVGVRRLR